MSGFMGCKSAEARKMGQTNSGKRGRVRCWVKCAGKIAMTRWGGRGTIERMVQKDLPGGLAQF